MESSVQKTRVNIKLKHKDQAPTVGSIEMQIWGDRDRLLRALKIFGLCWLFSIVSVFVPGLHFVLVPGFFIAGPIGAWMVYRNTSLIRGGKGICPNCQKEFDIVQTQHTYPVFDLCNHCQSEVEISL